MREAPLSAEQIDVEDVYQAIELYYERGWTDGLPVVPPTEKRVRAFLDAAGLAPDDVLGEIPERDRIRVREHLHLHLRCRPASRCGRRTRSASRRAACQRTPPRRVS